MGHVLVCCNAINTKVPKVQTLPTWHSRPAVTSALRVGKQVQEVSVLTNKRNTKHTNNSLT
jgi:hypothetical protein